MKFSQFIDVFVAALYNETQIANRRGFRIRDILDKYGLELTPTWADALFKDYTFSSRIDARRHLGPFVDQQVEISPEGIRWVEDELGENVGEFLERNGARYTPLASEGPFDPNVFDPNIFDTESTIESSTWTGLPRTGVLAPDSIERLRAALNIVDDAVSRANCSNEERAQARAYALAIQALADAPEPPADLIWTLIERASSIAGIAAFFVSLMALFSHG